MDRTADVEVEYRGGGRVSVRALQQEVATLRSDLTAAQAAAEGFATADTISALTARVASTEAVGSVAQAAAQAARSAAEAAQVTADGMGAESSTDVAVAVAVAAAIAPIQVCDPPPPPSTVSPPPLPSPLCAPARLTTSESPMPGPGALQAQLAALTANATCQAALMTAIVANARALPSMCEMGEGGTCTIGCRPEFVSTLATNIARGKPVRTRGNALIRSGETVTLYLPRAITDGVAPSGGATSVGQAGGENDVGRWLAWCDSGQPGAADSSRPAQRGDRPCLVTIDLEEVRSAPH